MIKKNNIVTFTSAALLAVTGLALVLTSSNIKLKVSSFLRGRASEEINGTIVFSRSTGSHVVRSNDYYYTSGTTQTGGTVYLRNHSGTTLGNNYVAVMENGGEITFSETNVGTNPTHYQFQKITSIYARSTSANSRLLEVRTSTDGVNYSSSYQDFYVTSSGTTFNFGSDGAQYVKITYSSNLTVYLEELSLSYNCTPGGVDPEKTVSSIAVKTEPSKTSYNEGDYFDPSGLVITATYDDSSLEDIAYSGHESDFGFSPSLSTVLTTDVESVSISYRNKSCSQSITVESGGAVTSLSGLYSFTNVTQYSSTTVIMDFNNNYYYKDGASSSKLYFTYEITESSIVFTLEASRDGKSSCDYGMFATNYRLFGNTNANGATKSGTLSNNYQTITVVINNYSRDFTKQ